MAKKKSQKKNWLKPALALAALALVMVGTFYFTIKSNYIADYVVETNAFFAPFEFYEGSEIKGVDVEIIDRVAKKMDKKIQIKNVDFAVIIDNVADGKIADAGAAGITITPARSEKVDFSIPYYTSVQYVIYDKTKAPEIKNNSYIVWESLAGKTIGTQTDTTGYLFADGELAEGGILENTGTTLKGFESAQLAADGILANLVDVVIVDELPAKFITSKNQNLACLPLYYSGEAGEPDSPAEESYAIAVNKSKPELLEAINSVLKEMIENDEINQLVLKYMDL